MKEKRTEPRIDVCLTARWQGCVTHRDVRISDLSQGGCYLDTIAEVTVGETLFLKILMANGDWLELESIVAHHMPRLGFGVYFVNLNEQQRHQIRSFLGIPNPNLDESSEPTECCETLRPLEGIQFTSSSIM
jgi:hypothetical protein